MKRITLRIASMAALLALLPAWPLAAQEGSFTGGFSIGLRSVDIGGADRKFREDFNLDDGPRLFDFHFDLVPEGSQRKVADQVVFDASNLGGDPFETIHFSARKYGDYKLVYNRTVSDYFYQDLIIPVGTGDLEKSQDGDFHHFDFQRVRDTASLDIDLTQRATLTFGLERYTKTGESTTTLDIQRDEFEFDKPIDESLNTYIGGLSYAWEKATLTLTERVRDYENVYEVFLPGFSEGGEEGGSTLDFFFLDQPYSFTSNEHTVQLALRPSSKLHVDLLGNLQSLDLDVDAEERSQGIGFSGAPFSEDVTGNGTINRDIDQYLVDLNYRVSDRVGIVAGARSQKLDQSGDFQFGGALNAGDWNIETTAFDAGIEFYVSSELTVAGGVVQETRKVDSDWSVAEGGEEDGRSESMDTDNTGFYATASWRPMAGADVTVDLESNSFDDPFTLASPTDRERYRVRGKYRWDNGLNLSGGYTKNDYENSNSGWNADTEHLTLRLGWAGDRFDGSLGYSNVSAERSIDQLVNESTLFAVFYESDSDFLDGRFRFVATDRISFGADLRSYQNDGSFGVERDDYRGWIQIGFLDGYNVRAAYRMVDYNETGFNFDDYDADIVELSLGYDW